jgi:cytochrome c oxidase subunit 2
MKILTKFLAVAAAFGLGSGAAIAADAPAAAPAPTVTAAPAPEATPAPAPAATPAPTAGADAAAPAAADAAPTKAPAYVSPVSPRTDVGVPDGRMGIQEQVTPIGKEAQFFHDWILMPVITLICIIVLLLLGWVILRYRRAAHPVPSRTTHNTMVEVIWTLVPVLILVVMAVPSIRLLANQYSPPNADVTIKVTGHQWYWQYQYPDHGIDLTSNLLPEAGEGQPGQATRTDADGPRLLAVDERMVVPVGATVKLIVTADPTGVIHAFGVPAFWVKIDAVPGRLNETWFRAEQPGIYYGQCYELCGARHAYMPIAVEVVSQEDFERWVASRNGTMPGAAPAAAAAAPAPAAAVSANASTEATPAPPATVNATAPANATNQAATGN